ncbi:MAG: hypothetical protein EOO01_21965 [Chitinophagaceae bacterium]|nr:MAG: hypothetical protein EOO01_21965 [Chitinophagaceae bacterium]
MNRPLLLLLIFCIAATQALSQANHCNCSGNFEKLIEKTEANYAGFPTKINTATQTAYQSLVRKIRQQIVTENNPKRCYYLLAEYVQFFRDKHFILSYANEKDADIETIEIDESGFKKSLSLKKTEGIEGIWVNPDSSMKLAISKFPGNVYKAIVLTSADPKLFPGLVYLTFLPSKKGLRVKTYNVFMTTEVPAKQKGNLLQVWNQQLFGRIYPGSMSTEEKNELRTWRDHNNGLAFRQLSARTTHLKIPSFYNNDDKIQALISRSDSMIRNTENLIVDLTGNGGGNTGWVHFMPYFMTNPVIQEDTHLRVTPENVKARKEGMAAFVLSPIPDEYKKYFPDSLINVYKKVYAELSITKEPFYPTPAVTFPLDSILSKPIKIALLVDDLCGSSTEYFFYLSKQSRKTIRYGIPTMGMMDYEGMSNPTPLPYDKFILTIPIARSSWTTRNPIDDTGFKPEKDLGHIPAEHWVEHVRMELENK